MLELSMRTTLANHVQTVTDRREITLDELLEEPRHLVTVRRAREADVLAWHTHARVQYHGHQEARLALCEAEFLRRP